jgi:hypothetical protein
MSRDDAAAASGPSFYEIVLEGNPDRARGVLVGLALGAGAERGLRFCSDEGVRATLGERLKGMVGHAALHAIVDSALRDIVKRHAKPLEEDHGILVVADKRIRTARFGFSYHAYAPRYREEIQKLLGSLPPGVELEGGEPRETLDESAAGLEIYSPTHHYEVEGEGEVGGPIDRVIEARHQLGAHPLVKVGAVELDLE